MKRTPLRFKDAFSNFEYDNSMTVYNGEKCTIARARALKAAESRKRAREERKSSIKNELTSSLYETCRRAKAIRMLKSIRAYARNGETQWGALFIQFLNQHRDIKRSLYRFVGIYDDAEKLLKELKCSLRKDLNTTLNIVEQYGYKMQDMVETVEKFGNAVFKSQAADQPLWKDHEIIKGSDDGKRVGLRKIQSQMTSSMTKMRNGILAIARESQQVYNDLKS